MLLQIVMDVMWPCCWACIVISHEVAHVLDLFSLVVDNEKQCSGTNKCFCRVWTCQDVIVVIVNVSNAVSEPRCWCCCRCLASCRRAPPGRWPYQLQCSSKECRCSRWRWRGGGGGGSREERPCWAALFRQCHKDSAQATVSRPRLPSPGHLRQGLIRAVTSQCSGEVKRCRQTRSGRSCNYI
jgi:hypothetical protein